MARTWILKQRPTGALSAGLFALEDRPAMPLHDGQVGETLFVSSAAGAVGSTVVQIAKALGLRVIGSAGGPEKCAAVAKLGADAVLDYRTGDLFRRLGEAAPDGIGIYFDNVGTDHLAAAIDHIRLHMRVVLCGMIAGYGGDALLSIKDPMRLVAKRIHIKGHFVPDYFAERSRFHADMCEWFRQGLLTCPVNIHHGIEPMPEAFLSLYRGGTVGKVLVRLGD